MGETSEEIGKFGGKKNGPEYSGPRQRSNVRGRTYFFFAVVLAAAFLRFR